MGDFNQLSTGTVSHSHNLPSDDGHSLNETTKIFDRPLTGYIVTNALVFG